MAFKSGYCSKTKLILLATINNYAPGIEGDSKKLLDRFADFAIKYYEDFVKPNKFYKNPSEGEKEALVDLKNHLSDAMEDATAEDIQNIVFEVGKKHKYDPLKNWFQMLYETLLGQQEGPRMGSFIKIYGLKNFIKMIKSWLK